MTIAMCIASQEPETARYFRKGASCSQPDQHPAWLPAEGHAALIWSRVTILIE
jgi:hypothetical protein